MAQLLFGGAGPLIGLEIHIFDLPGLVDPHGITCGT